MQMIQHFLKQKWTFPGNSKTDISHLDTQVVHWCPASNQLGLVGCLQTTNHPQTLHQGSGKPFSQANILHNSTLGLIWHLNWHWLCYVVWGQRLCLAQCENVLHTILHDHLWVRLNAAVQTPLCMFLNLTAKRDWLEMLCSSLKVQRPPYCPSCLASGTQVHINTHVHWLRNSSHV